eukprot:CAMPEP_0183702912 /NCGR_PEP_ID=MMETSP0737-20130205/857_1 /TAXON_ID=385413 /ORGANISM="Thalassiosira miniscula, Strain CCMP1093" /LENGTH=139 /DNA_ID=CAMNT_0025929595 /DNA_START=189 /DNA_END=608 /DNA_ORIENTATION=-
MSKQPQTSRVLTTTAAKSPAKINIRDLSEADLKSLQRKDPFMYHSIPSVHKAKLLNKDIDHSKLAQKETGDAGTDSDADADLNSSMVSRKSRISTECHMSVMIEDLLNMDGEEFRLECEGEGFDFDFEVASLLGNLRIQ